MKQSSSWLLAAALLLTATVTAANQPTVTVNDTQPTPTTTAIQQPETTTTQAPAPTDQTEILKNLNALVKKCQVIPEKIHKNLKHANDAEEPLSEEFLADLIKDVLSISKPTNDNDQEVIDLRKALKDSHDALGKQLKAYQISGVSLTVDPNGAFIGDTQDPKFTVTYCNEAGKIKTRTYQASIDSWGAKVELAIKCDMIFFIGTDTDFYTTNKVIELDNGIEIGGLLIEKMLTRLFPSLNQNLNQAVINFQQLRFTRDLALWLLLEATTITYIPFKNASGGLLMLSISAGIPLNYCSYVSGGTLTPVTE